MMRFALTTAVLLLAVAVCADAALAHGGTYGGPGGQATPGYSGPSGTTTPGPNPNPGPVAGGGGTTPGGSGGTTGPNNPGTGPSRPSARPAAGAAAGAAARGRATGGRRKSNAGPNFTGWDWWWDLNEERFLNLKNKVRSEAKASDNADTFLGEEASGEGGAAVTTRIIRKKILPVLKQAIKDDYYDARSGALIAVGKVGYPGDADILDAIKGYLNDKDKQVRESSCLALGVLGNKDSVEFLMKVVRNDKEAKRAMGRGTSDILNRTRAFAAVAVGLIGSRDGLDDKVVDDLLMEAKRDIKGDVDRGVGPALALGLIKSEKAVPGMVELFANPEANDYVRAHVGVALGKVGARTAIRQLVKGLTDKKTHVCRSSAIALGLLTPPDDKKTIKKLRQYAKAAPDRATRNFCIMALGEIGGNDAKALLMGLVKKGKNVHDRTFGALALGVAGFNKEDGSNREMGKLILDRYKSTKSDGEKGAYAIALGLLEYLPPREFLAKDLESAGHQALKGPVCTALGLMNDRNAIPAIQALVKQRGDPDLRKRAAIALGLLKDPEAVDTLKGVIESNVKSKAVLGAATVALGYVGDSRAVPILAQMLSKDDAGVYFSKNVTRAFATVALGFLGDKDPIPMLSKVQENSNYLAQTQALAELLTIL
jgi:HEAT repeat protein